MLYLILAGFVVLALVVAVPAVRRSRRLDEVNRFHVARSLTTSWSQTSEREGERLPD